MSLEVAPALRGGFEKLKSGAGLTLVGIGFLYQLAFTIITASLVVFLFRDTIFEQQAPTADAVFSSIGAIIPLVVAAWVLGTVLALATARTFVSEDLSSLSPEAFSRRVVVATLTLMAISVLTWIAVSIGLVLLVVPGLFVAVSLAFSLFFVATEDDGVLDSMRNSWGLAKGNRVEIFVLMLAIAILQIVVNFVIGLVIPEGSLAGLVVTALVTSLTWVYTIAALSEGYLQLQGSDAKYGDVAEPEVHEPWGAGGDDEPVAEG